MSTRTDGYVEGVDYVHGYFKELNPLHMRLAFLGAGRAAPRVETACELGCGYGVSLGIHAAASQTQWFGNDFNPTHIAFARGLSGAAGADLALYTDSFADFANRTDLPDFDFIGLHGVWSWISDETRTAIVDFLRRRLKVGGVLYVSYNALPGWAAFAPIRHLMTEHARFSGNSGTGIVDRIDGALAFTDRLLSANPDYAKTNPKIVERFGELQKENRRYLAHEYFNRDWHPMHFAAMGPWLAPADLTYACSATYGDDIDAITLNPAEKALLAEIGDPSFRQTVRDFMVNRQFRRDYWIRGATPSSDSGESKNLSDLRVVLVAPKPELSIKIRAALTLTQSGPGDAVLTAVLALLGDRLPRTVAEIAQSLAAKDMPKDRVRDAVMLLASQDLLAAAHAPATTAAIRSRTDRLNAHLIAAAASGGEVRTLASPVTGGGIDVGHADLLFLAARRGGLTEPAQWADEVRRVAGTATVGDKDIAKRVQDFATVDLPALEALQIVQGGYDRRSGGGELESDR